MENTSCTVTGKILNKENTNKSSLLTIIVKGLWKENPGLCQLLGLCPLLAVTTTAVSALGLGIATTLVVIVSSTLISLLRAFIFTEVRIPIYVVVIATLVTVVRFYVEAYFPSLYDALGIYLSLIVTNCIIMGRAEAFAGRNNPLHSAVDGLACGVGFSLVLFTLGSLREILGNGTWMYGAHELLGNWAKVLELNLLSSDHTYLVAILPPGGFFLLAALIASKNAIDLHKKNKQKSLQIEAKQI